jgi:hypothetical protein
LTESRWHTQPRQRKCQQSQACRANQFHKFRRSSYFTR